MLGQQQAGIWVNKGLGTHHSGHSQEATQGPAQGAPLAMEALEGIHNPSWKILESLHQPHLTFREFGGLLCLFPSPCLSPHCLCWVLLGSGSGVTHLPPPGAAAGSLQPLTSPSTWRRSWLYSRSSSTPSGLFWGKKYLKPPKISP